MPEAYQIFVTGYVTRPGPIALHKKVTLSMAIAMAGGTLEATKSDQIRIERQKKGGASKDLLVFDLNAIRKRQAEDPVLQPGDIVVFANTYRAGLSHTGIYVGDGQFVHAANERTGVVVSNLWDSYWGPRFVGASRALA